MFMYLPFLLAFLTVMGIAMGWRLLSNSLWLATMGLVLWWFCNHLAKPPGFTF
ncbi:hypothetical protein [Herbaspirillum sp. NPDC087042]|uniref:hypothetical protein n=1 Tax=Herbaspirillum sp. NPDC087042 TaxID=3364004 RepID=UPI0037F4CB64